MQERGPSLMAKRPLAKPLVDPLATRVSYLLRRVSAMLMDDLASSLWALELRPVEASILVVVAGNPGCKQAQIGRTLDIQAANLAPLIGTLVVRGLLAKSRMDGRSQSVVLTTSGKVAAKRAERIMDQIDKQVSDALGEVNYHELAGRLRALLALSVNSQTSREAGDVGQTPEGQQTTPPRNATSR